MSKGEKDVLVRDGRGEEGKHTVEHVVIPLLIIIHVIQESQ